MSENLTESFKLYAVFSVSLLARLGFSNLHINLKYPGRAPNIGNRYP